MCRVLRNVRNRLIAATYNFAMAASERRCLQHWRAELLTAARGNLLEIGAGTGLNLRHYPADIQLTLSEPDPWMRQQLKQRIAHGSYTAAPILPQTLEQLSLDDGSFDTIVSTLVLCSVPDQAAGLQRLHRLLRPGGRLLYLEHIISDEPRTRRRQQRLEPLWSLCAGGCRLTRDTPAALEAAGFSIISQKEERICGAPAFVRRCVRGIACKP